MKYHMGIRTIMVIGLEIILFHFGKEFSRFCSCPKTLCEGKFHGGRLIDLLEMSRQSSVLIMACIELAVF